MSTTIHDIKGGMSNCCGALMYEDWGICIDCKEHCENVADEPEDTTDDRVFTSKQQDIISRNEAACAKAGCDDNGHKCV
jgi:hypothetical protein